MKIVGCDLLCVLEQNCVVKGDDGGCSAFPWLFASAIVWRVGWQSDAPWKFDGSSSAEKNAAEAWKLST